MKETLPLFTRKARGHKTVFVEDECLEPLIKKGQYAVINTHDRRPREAELYVVRYSSPLGQSTYIKQASSRLLNVTAPGAKPSRVWFLDEFRGFRRTGSVEHQGRRVPVFAGLSDGPYKGDDLRERLVGRVVGYAMSPLESALMNGAAAVLSG